jgi:hypothetical protein
MLTVSLTPFGRAGRGLLVAMMSGVIGAACVPIGGQSEPPPAELEPDFAPDSATSDSGSNAPTAAPSTDAQPTDPSSDGQAGSEPAPTTGPTGSPTSSPSPTTAAPFRGSATVTDAPSDRTATLEPSPDWADLQTVTIERDGNAMTLAVGLTGGAPGAAPDAQHTMNIATFFDVDGDGFLDYEIWANLNDSGWGTAYYDNVDGQALFADQDGIEIAVVAGEVVMTFDASLLGGAERFRFAASSEYGRYETIGTELMARDDAPDDDQPARFPG